MSNRERVLEFLRNAGHAGATNEQILSHTGIRPHQQVFMITRELSRLGKIKGIQSGKEWRFWVSGTQTPVARSEAPPLKTRAAARQNGIAMPAQFNMTAAEDRYLLKILAKDKVLRGLLEANRPSSEPAELLAYLTAVKNALGNLNNDMSFVASLLEPISKSPEEDNEASELYEAEEVLGVVFPTDEDAALPLNPSKEALHEPASHIAA